MRSMLLALALLAGCEPFHQVDATVEVSAADLNKPLIVTVVEGQPWNGVGLPEPIENANRVVMLASIAREGRIELSKGGVFCPRSLYVAAWIDRDDSSGIAAMLDGRTLTVESYRDDDDRDLLRELAELEPGAGDGVAVVGPLDFDPREGGPCDPPVMEITVTLPSP